MLPAEIYVEREKNMFFCHFLVYNNVYINKEVCTYKYIVQAKGTE